MPCTPQRKENQSYPAEYPDNGIITALGIWFRRDLNIEIEVFLVSFTRGAHVFFERHDKSKCAFEKYTM